MAIPLWASRSSTFSEFSEQEQKQFFDLKQKKVICDYDNFYYTVFLNEEECASSISHLITLLNRLREEFDYKSDVVPTFYDLDYYPFGMKFYNNRLSLAECFDILICSTLPNDKTPRICVQLRARYLWLYGFEKCFRESVKVLNTILSDFEIDVLKMQENRIDYAFHTNCIQNFEKFFDRAKLKNNCSTPTNQYYQHGDPQKDWSIDTFTVGSRSSTSVFFRAYNKTREVVEKAYKGFFFELWLKHGLISSYDQYCLEFAYKQKSYDVGLLIGRINWYLEHGHNEEFKRNLEKLVVECYADSCNTAEIRKQITGVLPEVTVICNIEYETHTDFYRSFNKSLLGVQGKKRRDTIYERIYKIYDCRKAFVDYLTSFDGTVSFVDNVKLMRVEIQKARNAFTRQKDYVKYFDEDGYNAWKRSYVESHYLHWWKRVRAAKLGTKYMPEIYRSYERKIDVQRMKKRFVSNIATLSIFRSGRNQVFDFNEDLSRALALINDNDMQVLMPVDLETGETVHIKFADYYTEKQRKNRQYSFLDPEQTVIDISSPDQSDDI